MPRLMGSFVPASKRSAADGTPEPDHSADGACVRSAIDRAFSEDSRRIRATLVRLLGDFDLAEEAMQDAAMAALERWPREGIPESPRAWLVSAGRYRAIDRLRRRARHDGALSRLAALVESERDDEVSRDDPPTVRDDQLRLAFLCCHPALPVASQAALTLREVCGLTTEEIARAYLVGPSTVAQRIVRAKSCLRDAGITAVLPPPADLSSRMAGVMRVIYLVFNEGYAASAGSSLLRPTLSAEALRLGRLLVELVPEPETYGLLALMTLHDARRASRVGAAGDLVLLDAQDRTLWDRDAIREAGPLVERALGGDRFGPYGLQAAIAAVHADSRDGASTDWPQLVGLYDLLFRVDPSPVVALNRALARSMRDGPASALKEVEELRAAGELERYVPLHAAYADLCRRLGRRADARAAYELAISLSLQETERAFFGRRLAELA